MDERAMPGLARAVAELSSLVLGENDLQAGLRHLAEAARDAVPGCDDASITLIIQGTPTTPAASTGMAVEVDLLQYEHREGPCLDAMSKRRLVRVDVLADDERYSHLAPGAVERGVASILSSPLEAGDEVLGALNLYSFSAHAFDETSEDAALPLTREAARVIAGSRVYELTRKLAQDMEQALETRELIGQAMGVLMTRHNIGPKQASELLGRACEQEGRRVRDVAEDMVRRHHQAVAE